MVYLDCNATTPIEPEVLEVVIQYLRDDYGNAGSRTHEFGLRAKLVVDRAREAVASVVDADPQEVLFTSGATESNNLAILGLAAEGRRSGRRHIVASAIEHKAVLEPLAYLAGQGFDVTLVPAVPCGFATAESIASAVRPDTLLVSVMHVNNETGVIQPLESIAASLAGHDCYLHVDAAQGFGKEWAALTLQRVDLVSVSGHKIFGPKGIGALIARRRGRTRLPLEPISYGGGQERGLRPGTLPVPLIAGLGEAARIARRDHATRRARCLEIKREFVEALAGVPYRINGDEYSVIPSTLNLSIAGVDSEAAMVALKGVAAVSNGSACTSSSYQPSHVLKGMNLPEQQISEALRFSWCHLTGAIPWREICSRLAKLAT